MTTYTLKRSQKLGISKNQAWDFFKNPKNLKEITPDHLGFDIITESLPEEIHTDLLIEYRVKPILGIPLKWITQISNVDKPNGFVDLQIKGPYKLWHHEHTFDSIEGGVLMVDKVTYALPLGWIGKIFHPIIIKPQLEKIFNYRFKYLEEKFPFN